MTLLLLLSAMLSALTGIGGTARAVDPPVVATSVVIVETVEAASSIAPHRPIAGIYGDVPRRLTGRVLSLGVPHQAYSERRRE